MLYFTWSRVGRYDIDDGAVRIKSEEGYGFHMDGWLYDGQGTGHD